MSGCILELATDKYDKEPIWPMLDKKFVDWPDNPRFAVCDNDSPDMEGYHMVLDKETGLIWARHAQKGRMTWNQALASCINAQVGNRSGWRLPTVFELASLRYVRGGIRLLLPNGHPFIDVQSGFYWSSTSDSQDNSKAWVVPGIQRGMSRCVDKDSNYWVWPVRGGSGPATATQKIEE
jgi:hypothetical protein